MMILPRLIQTSSPWTCNLGATHHHAELPLLVSTIASGERMVSLAPSQSQFDPQQLRVTGFRKMTVPTTLHIMMYNTKPCTLRHRILLPISMLTCHSNAKPMTMVATYKLHNLSITLTLTWPSIQHSRYRLWQVKTSHQVRCSKMLVCSLGTVTPLWIPASHHIINLISKMLASDALPRSCSLSSATTHSYHSNWHRIGTPLPQEAIPRSRT
jgi:hypothetical protein